MDKQLSQELKKWRKILEGVLARADRPHRLDRFTTRGKHGVAYDPMPSGNCSKHRVLDKDGKYSHTVFDPFCKVCFPERPRGRE